MQYIKLYRTRKLNIYENELYCLLCDCCNLNNGYCQKSRNDLMNMFPVEISEGTLRRTIVSLENKKFILVTRTGTNENIYEVLKNPEFYSELDGN